jgi:hypothetical protein
MSTIKIKIPASINISNNIVTINPTNPLLNGKEYFVVVKTSTKDIYSQNLIEEFTSKFTTELKPSFNITAPNGSEIYSSGTVNIVWDSINILESETVKLMLYKNDIYDSDVVASTLNSGSYLWNYTIGAGHDYKIKIELISDVNLNDLSDDDFTIQNLVEQQNVIINSGVINKEKEQQNVIINSGFL